MYSIHLYYNGNKQSRCNEQHTTPKDFDLMFPGLFPVIIVSQMNEDLNGTQSE